MMYQKYLKLNVFGDFVPINRGIKAVDNGTAISKKILDLIQEGNHNIVNLECPVVENGRAKSIVKDGPHLKTSEDSVRYLKDCGFDMVTLANNHLNDFGEEGIQDTFNACEKYGIRWVGAGKNLKEARSPKVIEKNGIKIGIINICENESSIATDEAPGSNPIDEINNYYDIVQLQSIVDKVIMILHGGVEYYRFPSPRMKKLCHFYADLGVSAIVCHHTHCYSGYEVYHGVPIFYSLGNFFFDRPNKTMQWKTGYFVQLAFGEDTKFNLYPYVQCDVEAQVRLMTVEEKEQFNLEIKNINEFISNDFLLNNEYNNWLDYRKRHYMAIAETWAGKLYKAAYRRGCLPAFISKKNAVLLLNNIRCESHHDLFVKSLLKYIEK